MQRDTYIDSIKTILIFTVVLTHGLVRLGSGSVDEYIVMNFLYTSNMPLFEFVSGLLFNTSKSWAKVLLGGGRITGYLFLVSDYMDDIESYAHGSQQLSFTTVFLMVFA